MLLEALSNARGVSGNEDQVRDIILQEIRGYIDTYRVDALGNLLCVKKPRHASEKWPHKVMIAAHMDEIGLIVTGINENGTLRFDKVGGIDDRILLSKQVLVGEKEVPGVIGYRPIHLIAKDERDKAIEADKLSIDIGASDEESAKELVTVGDYVSFRTAFGALDEESRTVKGKAFDDRAGCAVLIELLKETYDLEIHAAFTTQEEVGLRGARVASYSINPDAAFVLEGTICDDLPKKKDTSPVTELGKGPAITFMDRSFVADRRLVELLVTTAKQMDIPYQFKRAVAGGTDAGAIHLAREGVPSVTVSVPSRYIHAPVSLLSLSDFDHTVQLLRAALYNLEGGLP
ncbi:MAG: M42 family metallopeptidase [Chloroflexota bacterium]|nr:M42 family metallopeptidase [Chloroflexota bacterium]